ncbi:MAG TPA: oligosaccharide flippase family protein [Kofleriaceae bacterium]
MARGRRAARARGRGGASSQRSPARRSHALSSPRGTIVARATAFVAAASALLGLFDLVSTLVCIRLWVTTADFGAATLAIALFPILDRLGGMMLGASLVRDPEHESTVFWLNLGAAGGMLALLVALRPVIGAIAEPIVASLLAAYGIRLVVQAGSVVPEARMRRALRFGELSTIRVIAGVTEMVAKLSLAYAGEHVWCFALAPIINTIVTTFAIQLREPWRPRASFDRGAAVRAARFAGALSGGELLYYAYASADYLVVGAYFGNAAVGAYRLAYEAVLDVVKLVSTMTAEVAYPVLATSREVGADLVRFTRQNALALAPILVFIALEADDLLAALYGTLPHAAATAARILCAVGALRVCSFELPPMLAGVGAARRVLAYHAVAAIVLPAAFAIAGALGSDFTAIAWAWAAAYPIAFAVLLVLALPLAQLTLRAYLAPLGRVAVCALGAAIAGEAARVFLPAGPLRLACAAAAIVIVYAALLARLEGVTPFAVARAITAKARDTAPPTDT